MMQCSTVLKYTWKGHCHSISEKYMDNKDALVSYDNFIKRMSFEMDHISPNDVWVYLESTLAHLSVKCSDDHGITIEDKRRAINNTINYITELIKPSHDNYIIESVARVAEVLQMKQRSDDCFTHNDGCSQSALKWLYRVKKEWQQSIGRVHIESETEFLERICDGHVLNRGCGEIPEPINTIKRP